MYTLPANVISFLRKGKIYLYSSSACALGQTVLDLKNLRLADVYKGKGVVDFLEAIPIKEGKKR